MRINASPPSLWLQLRGSLACLAVLTLPSPALAVTGEFVVRELVVPGQVRSVVPGDLDGDGLTDLVVGFVQGVEPGVSRWLTVYWQDRSGAFAPSAGSTFPLPELAAVFDVSPLAPGEHARILLLTYDGVDEIAFDGRTATGPRRLVDVESIVMHGEHGGVTHLDFARDLFGDGQPRLVVPQWGKVTVLQRGVEGWDRQQLKIPQEALYKAGPLRHGYMIADYSLQVVVLTPVITSGDVDGDGVRDLLVHLDDNLFVYRRSADGAMDASPSTATHFRIRTDDEKRVDAAAVSMRLADVDGDGRIDAVVNKLFGGVRAMQGRTEVYLGLGDGTFTATPAWALDDTGYASSVDLVDVDQDGAAELISPIASLGLLELSRIVISGSIDLSFRIFRAGKGRDTEPVARFSFDVLLDYSGAARLRSPDPDFTGDFDGDGHNDLLLARGSGTLEAYPALGRGFDLDHPVAVARVPVSRYVQVFDAGGGKRDDVLVSYPTDKERADLVEVLLLLEP